MGTKNEMGEMGTGEMGTGKLCLTHPTLFATVPYSITR